MSKSQTKTTAKTASKTTEEGYPQLDRRIARVCDASGEFIEYWGFKAIHGRIWTLLALHTEPLPQSAIAQKLGVSRSLVSGAISDLAGFSLVKATGDHRNAPYRAMIDVWPTIADVLRSREGVLLEKARGTLEAAIVEAEEVLALGASIPYDLARLRLLLNMTEVTQALLRGLLALRIPKGNERLGQWLQRTSSFIRRFSKKSSR